MLRKGPLQNENFAAVPLAHMTGFPACGRAGSRGKRATGTFSDTAPFESL